MRVKLFVKEDYEPSRVSARHSSPGTLEARGPRPVALPYLAAWGCRPRDLPPRSFESRAHNFTPCRRVRSRYRLAATSSPCTTPCPTQSWVSESPHGPTRPLTLPNAVLRSCHRLPHHPFYVLMSMKHMRNSAAQVAKASDGRCSRRRAHRAWGRMGVATSRWRRSGRAGAQRCSATPRRTVRP